MRAARQRLVADAQAQRRRAVGERGKAGRRPVRIGERIGAGVGAHHQERGADARGKLEEAAGALQRPRALALGQRLEVAQRLQAGDGDAVFGRQRRDALGRTVEADEVLAEDLDGGKAGLRGGDDLLLQRAGEGQRRDRTHHDRSSAAAPPPGAPRNPYALSLRWLSSASMPST